VPLLDVYSVFISFCFLATEVTGFYQSPSSMLQIQAE
jgi:hypothetical protein